jgi:hypothetical protein
MSMIKIGTEEVNLDEKVLEVNHETMNDFLSKFAAFYRFYQSKHSDASLIARSYADQHASLLQSKFKHYKETQACSDKMAEACAKSDEEVVELQKKVRSAEYIKDIIYGFLRSMDYAHDNAKEICYNMRKEMSAIGGSRVKEVDYQKLEEIFSKDN